MVTETYVRAPEPMITDHESAAVQRSLAQEIKLARGVGLFVHADQLSAQTQADQMARYFSHPLSDTELDAWRTYLPTSYRMKFVRMGDDVALVFPGRKPWDNLFGMGEYEFDRVPKEVLEIMDRAKSIWKFDWLEILTPEKEKSRQDPVLIGGLGNRVFLLARWAESAAYMLDLSELPERARRIERIKYVGGWSRAGVAVLFTLSSVGSMFGLFQYHHSLPIFFSTLIGGFGLIATLMVIADKKTEQALARVYLPTQRRTFSSGKSSHGFPLFVSLFF